MINSAYPLQFPVNWKRTAYSESARFGNHSISQAIYNLRNEIERLGGTKVVISSNLLIKLDGTPYSGQRQPLDVGVAVYFNLKDKEQCFPCDRWNKVEHNVWAIYKSIEAIRGLERWGAKEMVESAFKGFKALPSPEQVTNTKVRYFSGLNSLEEGKAIFRNLVLEMHPDKGGTQEEFMEMNKQYVQFKQSMEGVR